MDFNQIFSTTTPGADIIYAVASSSINLFAQTIPFWEGWVGILIGVFAAFGIAYAIWKGVVAAMS